MSHVAHFYDNAADIDQNTGQSIQDYIDGGWQSGETEGNKWIGRELDGGETVETSPDIVVNNEPLQKAPYTPPSVPTPPL